MPRRSGSQGHRRPRSPDRGRSPRRTDATTERERSRSGSRSGSSSGSRSPSPSQTRSPLAALGGPPPPPPPHPASLSGPPGVASPPQHTTQAGELDPPTIITKEDILIEMMQACQNEDKSKILHAYLKHELGKAGIDTNKLPSVGEIRKDLSQGFSILEGAPNQVNPTPATQSNSLFPNDKSRLFQTLKDDWMNQFIRESDIIHWLEEKPPGIDTLASAATPRASPPPPIRGASLYSQPESQAVPLGVIYSNIRGHLIQKYPHGQFNKLPEVLPYGNTVEFDITRYQDKIGMMAESLEDTLMRGAENVMGIINALMKGGLVLTYIGGVGIQASALSIGEFLNSGVSHVVPDWLKLSVIDMIQSFKPSTNMDSLQKAFDTKYQILLCLITIKLVYGLGLSTHGGNNLHTIIENGFNLLNRYLQSRSAVRDSVVDELARDEVMGVDRIMHELRCLTQWYLTRKSSLVQGLMISVPGRKGAVAELEDAIPLSRMDAFQIATRMGDTPSGVESEPQWHTMTDIKKGELAHSWNGMTMSEREEKARELGLDLTVLRDRIREIQSIGAASATGTGSMGGGKRRKTKRKTKRKSKKRKSKKRKSKKRKTKRKSKRR